MDNEAADWALPMEKNKAAVEMGRKGGIKGGAMRAARMTPEERAASARQAAQARWARVASEAKAGTDVVLDPLGRPTKPFVFELSAEEALFISEAKGSGGQQTLHRKLVEDLAKGNLTIEMDDRQLGELIRYMTRYGSGGFQERLRRAFARSFLDLFNPIFGAERRV